MTLPLIEMQSVHKRFGENKVLAGVDLTIQKGKVTTIIGKSGMGKSVLLKHIIGLLEPDTGEIRFEGRAIQQMPTAERRALRLRFSYMFQGNALFDSMNIFDNIALPLRERHSLSEAEIKSRVGERLHQLDLVGTGDRYPSQVSGGMKKRVALARALVTDPEIVLFDEPTTGLDPIRKNAAHSMIADYQRRFGFTAVLVSHEIPDVFFISQRVAMLDEGKIIFDGTSAEIQESSSPVIQQFLKGLETIEDDLTGAAPKAQGLQKVQREMVRLQRHEIAFSLVLLRVNNLEAIIQMEGHVVSQTILQHLAAKVQRCIEVTDSHSRLGLNQIMVLLSNADIDRARAFCADLARVLESEPPQQIDKEQKACLSVTAGFVAAHREMAIEELIARAQAPENLFYEFKVC
jgi:phospholipid/cholesterol/gamma-HCH transport system ATP-binding protein